MAAKNKNSKTRKYVTVEEGLLMAEAGKLSGKAGLLMADVMGKHETRINKITDFLTGFKQLTLDMADKVDSFDARLKALEGRPSNAHPTNPFNGLFRQ